jgi:hypothetical protein
MIHSYPPPINLTRLGLAAAVAGTRSIITLAAIWPFSTMTAVIPLLCPLAVAADGSWNRVLYEFAGCTVGMILLVLKAFPARATVRGRPRAVAGGRIVPLQSHRVMPPVGHQKFHNLLVAILSCQSKCSMPKFIRGIDICSSPQKKLHCIFMSLSCCHLQCGSPSMKCGLLYVCITT